ncbi:MAG: ABC transporter permease [Vulcanimicrobiaceae bacterium]
MNISAIARFSQYGILSILRTPAQWIPMVVFPSMFLAFFGSQADSIGMANQVVASYVAFAVIGVGLFQFGVGVANERGTPWERYLRTLPMSALDRFTARILTALLFALVAGGIVVIVGSFVTKMQMTAADLGTLGFVAIVGTIPFIAMGLAIAYWFPPKAAMPITNLLYLVGAVVGGLWIPPQFLPHPLAVLSPYFPTRQFGEAMWAAVRGANFAQPLLWLAVFCAAMLLLAAIGYRRDQRTRFS